MPQCSQSLCQLPSRESVTRANTWLSLVALRLLLAVEALVPETDLCREFCHLRGLGTDRAQRQAGVALLPEQQIRRDGVDAHLDDIVPRLQARHDGSRRIEHSPCEHLRA